MHEPEEVVEIERKHDRDHREFAVIVNGRPKVVKHRELSFDEVVSLAFPNPPTGQNVTFTVTYSHAAGPKPTGTLVEGKHVKIRNGTVFNVTATDKS